jgi:ABC-type antimicrobial peptide transport system permease subunit
MAYSVAQRTQEIGIRLALGAETAAVRRMMVVQGMRLAILGVVVGLASAYGLTRFIASFLFGVKALDPIVFVGHPDIAERCGVRRRLGSCATRRAWSIRSSLCA